MGVKPERMKPQNMAQTVATQKLSLTAIGP